jgi:alkyl hydroperoxide reductase subunit AhpF
MGNRGYVRQVAILGSGNSGVYAAIQLSTSISLNYCVTGLVVLIQVHLLANTQAMSWGPSRGWRCG